MTPLWAFRGIDAVLLPSGKKALFVVGREFYVQFTIDGVVHEIRVPKSLLTDGTSIPRLFRGVVERFGEGVEAALVHDLLYGFSNKEGTVVWSRREADLILLAGLKKSGVSRWKREAMYWSVRIGGKLSFEKGTNTYLENMEELV